MAAARTKRSEMTDISAALRTFASKGRPTKEEQAQRRQLFQKVIQYLTIGIDMSPVFSDVIMNAHTTDVATKKMLYHYITHYAQANADLHVQEADAYQRAETRHREAQASVLEAQYRVEAKAVEAYAEKVEA